MRRVCKYLMGTEAKVVTLNPDPKRDIGCHVDAEFSGRWSQYEAEDSSAVLSRTGYVVSYSG